MTWMYWTSISRVQYCTVVLIMYCIQRSMVVVVATAYCQFDKLTICYSADSGEISFIGLVKRFTLPLQSVNL